MLVRVLFLGPARDFARTESAEFRFTAAPTVTALRHRLAEEYPAIARALPTMRIAVNYEFVAEEHVLADGDQAALIPPVSGGQGDSNARIELMRTALSRDEIVEFVSGDPAHGAVVAFEGATRAEHNAKHGTLVRLDYEAYEPMAIRAMESLAHRATQQWGTGKVAIVHRLGPVGVGEASIVIAVASGHRKEAFEACRWIIDTLKVEVPIWKRDVFEDGFVRWVEAEQATSEGA